MIAYLFMALAVFTALRLLKLPFEAAEWVWQLIAIVLSAGVAATSWDNWWGFLAIAALVEFYTLIENLLIVRADEALARIQRRR